jgi:hypothetical protein
MPVTEITVEAYPNPTSGSATLRLVSDRAGMASIVLIDVLGRTLQAITLDVSAHAVTETPLPTGGLPAGVYFVKTVVSTTTETPTDRALRRKTQLLVLNP